MVMNAGTASVRSSHRKLARLDAREAKVVELRFFGGLSAEETAEVLKVSSKTVLREWEHAKVWLMRELKQGDAA